MRQSEIEESQIALWYSNGKCEVFTLFTLVTLSVVAMSPLPHFQWTSFHRYHCHGCHCRWHQLFIKSFQVTVMLRIFQPDSKICCGNLMLDWQLNRWRMQNNRACRHKNKQKHAREYTTEIISILFEWHCEVNSTLFTHRHEPWHKGTWFTYN